MLFMIMFIISSYCFNLLTRFFAHYKIEGKNKFPLDYRSAFMALIKTSLDSNIGYTFDLFKNRPICIAIRFDKKPEIKDTSIYIGDNLRIYVSSPDQILASHVFNGMHKQNNFPIFDSKITKPKFVYLNEYQFYQRQTKMFYTLSPIVIRNPKDKTKYVTPTDDNFMDSFTSALHEQWKLYNDDEIGDIHCNIIKYNKVAMTHYGGLVLGFTGLFTIEADPNVLDFFYKSGVGYRRSNGFGFIEVDR